MPRFLSHLVLIMVLFSVVCAANGETFYVAPDGDDAAAGTSVQQAFATLDGRGMPCGS